MKYLFAAALVASTFASFGSAYAEGGCGPGFHRNPYGECRPNRGPVVVVEPALSWSSGPPWWSSPAAPARSDLSGATDVAVRSDRYCASKEKPR
jgi:hypothetical protein